MKNSLIKALLICGILAAPLYIGTDIFAATQLKGYSYADQAISELSAIGASTQSLWTKMVFLFNPLLIAFGMGVWKVADNKRSLRITGILLSIWGIQGFAWLFFPMHMRGAIGSFTDTMHLVLSGTAVLLITLILGFGSCTQGKWFRFYSILTIITTLIFGALVGAQAPQVAAQLPTPWMGIMERVCVYSPIIWMLVLAIALLSTEKKQVQI